MYTAFVQTTSDKKLGLGILAGISTGVFWGIPFLVPQLCPNFSALEIAFGRFFFFGLISFFFIKKVFHLVRGLNVRDRFLLLALSACGFWLYSTVLFWSVHATGGIVSSLVIGLLPVSIPLFTPGKKIGGFKFYGSLGILFLGLINLFAWPLMNETTTIAPPSALGIAGLITALAMWTWFAITNSKFLQRHPEINHKDFASVIGVISILSILPFFLATADFSGMASREGFSTYLIASIFLGLGSSWAANWLWNICSYHCPSEISGTLIVSETIFGLLYTFAYQKRAPHFYEACSIVLFMVGVFCAVTAQVKKPKAI